MATKMYDLSSVGAVIELGKNGYHVQYDAVNGWVEVLQADGTTLGRLQFAEPTAASDGATKNYVDVAITNLIDAAPGTMDTLNEIAAALNDDPDFYNTINNLITEIDANVDDLVTLSGVAENSSTLGTFTGSTLTDNSTIKGVLQDIETAHEETDANTDDLVTLSGVAENAVNLGAFSGSTIGDNLTVKAALQQLETSMENMEHGCRYVDFDTTGGPVNIGSVIPTNMAITDIRVVVETPWDSASPTMQVGVSGDADLIAGTAAFDLKDSSGAVQLVDSFYKTSGDTQFIITIDQDSATTGSARLLLDFCEVM